jgi:hypothetical protein
MKHLFSVLIKPKGIGFSIIISIIDMPKCQNIYYLIVKKFILTCSIDFNHYSSRQINLSLEISVIS